MNKITKGQKAEMIKLGASHFNAGKKLIPFDCIEVDAKLFAECKRQSQGSASNFEAATIQAGVYRQLRSAFNAGWMAEYHAKTA